MKWPRTAVALTAVREGSATSPTQAMRFVAISDSDSSLGDTICVRISLS